MNRMFIVVICLVRSVCLLFSMTMMNRTCVLDFVPTVMGAAFLAFYSFEVDSAETVGKGMKNN